MQFKRDFSTLSVVKDSLNELIELPADEQCRL